MGDIIDAKYKKEFIKILNKKFRWIPKFLGMCLGIYRLDSAHFLSATGLPWEAALKRPK